jgi:hypothetical protein
MSLREIPGKRVYISAIDAELPGKPLNKETGCAYWMGKASASMASRIKTGSADIKRRPSRSNDINQGLVKYHPRRTW